MRTRSVTVAAPASNVIISWFGYAMRSPAASTENGPASTPRIHSSSTSRVSPGTIEGNASPIFIASVGAITC